MTTAQAECQIANYASKRRTTDSASAAQNKAPVLELIPTLLSLIQDEEGNATEDVFQAQVCLGWLHWELSEPTLALSCLPKDLGHTVHLLCGNGQNFSPWTEVCIVKGGYMKGAAQELLSGTADAVKTMKTIVPRVSFPTSAVALSPQYLFWSERLLAKAALLSSKAVTAESPQVEESTIEFALTSFRAWASHREVKLGDPISTTQDSAVASPSCRSSIWRAYYGLLSRILQQRLPYFAPSEGSKRAQLASEFRRVETIYENAFLRNAKFPKAGDSNQEIEYCVEQVIQNWQILCGPEWQDRDFGEGGQDAFSRNVLDILYRAATKTFHSTLILRRLFQVHSVLAEFDLALKALDTYIHLVDAARSRARQAGKPAEGIEDNDIFVRTLSEGVIMVCCFGTYQKAEKAKHLTGLLERSLTSESDDKCLSPKLNGTDSRRNTGLSLATLAIAYRAVGIGLANWSRWTPITESRRDLQASAISSLEASLSEELGQDMNPASIFALSLMLAETRDLNSAIDRVRLALSSAGVMGDETQSSGLISYTGERDLVPLWHLLVLLLSACEEFETASHVCEAVLDTVMTADTYDDQPKSERQQQDEKIRILAEVGTEHNTRAFEDIEIRKKESIIELRMTQLSLIEVLHGPEVAVNHAEDLLALFGRFFMNIGLSESEQKPQSEYLIPPKSSAGVRGFRGSFFGRRKAEKGIDHEYEFGINGTAAPKTPPISDFSVDTPPPAIKVTDGNLNGSRERPQTAGTRSSSIRRKVSRQPHKLHRREGSIRKAIRHQSLERSSKSQAHSNQSHPDITQTNAQAISTLLPHIQPPGADHNGSASARQPLPPVPHNMKYNKEPPPIGHSQQPPQQDIRLPTSGLYDTLARTLTRFPKVHIQKQALGLLTKIWLFVAGLYRRAGLFEDALESWNEAKQQAKHVEELVAKQESSAKAFADPGWGGAQSSDELWGDVYAERGYLAQAQFRPFEAMKQFEEALIYFPDHIRATVGLANLLLDIWEQKIPAEEPELVSQPDVSSLSLSSPIEASFREEQKSNEASTPAPPPLDKDSPEYLARLAARDRAYGLLSALTKLGTAWDDAEAWFSLARAYEHGNQIKKAKEVLWWCIDLEDRRPVRHWWNVGSGGYVL
ncbi:hypothetical protein PRK78_002048 [Emydomyces testavorans]|uniref:Filamentation protein n=1 Tax=Emydomyces testavorans TaxID=2070801 RepID=A0AAF0DFA5_9EURO|nr:hypothetical protein PRK78_002048 [Emydomyces testavorans]